MSETKDPQDKPQFHTAEFHEGADGRCSLCNIIVAGSYYRLNGAKACYQCFERVQDKLPKDSYAKFARAFLFGIGGALLGMALYSGAGILLHLEIGYVSIAVGYLVGKAMMMGSGNIGGRHYQWLAVALTYTAVSLSAIPVSMVHYSQTHPHARIEPATQASDASGSQPDAAVASDQSSQSNPPSPFISARLFGALALYGFTSPFLVFLSNPVNGALGIFILVLGAQVAWSISAGAPRCVIEGPY